MENCAAREAKSVTSCNATWGTITCELPHLLSNEAACLLERVVELVQDVEDRLYRVHDPAVLISLSTTYACKRRHTRMPRESPPQRLVTNVGRRLSWHRNCDHQDLRSSNPAVPSVGMKSVV